MPRSVLLGRPWPQSGEPLFTDEDTAYAIALAEEERDTCPSCGYPKAVCRSADVQFTDFAVREEECKATRRLAEHRTSDKWTGKHSTTKDATMLVAYFREGHEAPIDAGLELTEQSDESEHGSEDR